MLMKLSRQRSLWKVFRDERGTSFMELAIAAPVLALFVLGIADLSRGLSERYRIQQAVNRSLEMAQTGRDIDYSFLRTEASTAAGVPESQVVQEQWIECGGSRRSWTEECPSGETARWVKLTITSYFTPLFGTSFYPSAQADGSVMLTAHASLRVR